MPAASAVTLSSVPGSPFPAGDGALDVATADLNADGRQDAVTANWFDESVTVYLGDGAGGFQQAAGSPVATGRADALEIADFNGDTKPDLAVANRVQSNVAIMLGDGNGGFSAALGSPVSLPPGSSPVDIAVGDLNGDGKADFATANFDGHDVSVRLGDGSGGFTAGAGSASGTARRVTGLTIANLDGDSNADVATANFGDSQGGNDVGILLSDGAGGLTAATPFFVGTDPKSVAAGDFNGDGSTDLAVARYNPSLLHILLGDGSGGFVQAPGSPFHTYHDPAEEFAGVLPDTVAIGDMNADGKLDVLTANVQGTDVSLFVGDGDGRFTHPAHSPFEVGAPAYGMALADLNGDGRRDVLTVSHKAVTETPPYAGTLRVLLNAAPDTLIASGPSGSVQSTTATFEFASPDASSTFECRLDGGAWVACTSPKTYSGLAAGQHTFEVRSTNDAGKTDPSPAARTWTVLGPATTITGGPTGTTRRTTATFTFASPSNGVAGFECRLDGGSWTACASPRTYGGVGHGSHTFEVRSIDGAGNVDPAPPSRTWTVDLTTPPDAALRATPNPVLTGDRVDFDASASRDLHDGSIVEYRWDLDGDGSFELDTNGVPTASRTYEDRGVVDARVQVTTDSGLADLASVGVDVRAAPPAGVPRVSINEGARFTNRRRVKVFTVWPRLATSLLISEDGGFRSARSFEVAAAVPWTLDAGASELVPRVVYVRFLGGESGPEVYQDDIILDQTRPVVRAARVASERRVPGSSLRAFTLKLRAADAVSGVRQVQTAANKRNPSPAVGYRETLRVRAVVRPRWVRVRDGAGNWSLWRRVPTRAG